MQYASYTTKCPGTTSGLSGKQATHDGVQALPPVGTGPAHKGCLPDQRNGVTRSGDNPATQQVSRNCHPPKPATQQSVQVLGKSRVSGKGDEHHNQMELSHYHEHVQIRWKAKSPSIFIFRLVTAVSFTSN